MKELSIFLYAPTLIERKEMSVGWRLFYTFLIFVILIFSQIVIQVAFSLIGDSTEASKISDYDERITEKTSFFYVVIIGPIIEELAFRLALTKFNTFYIRVSLSVLVGLVLTILIFLITPRIGVNVFVLEALIAIAVYLVLLRMDFRQLEMRWEVLFVRIVWISYFIFCCIHLPQLIKFGFDFVTILRAVLGFFVCAVLYNFIRLKHGFLYAVGLHCLYNYITTLN